MARSALTPLSLWLACGSQVYIVLAFICLLSAKGLNICVPLALKAAVDAASEGRMPLMPVVCYGLFRFLTDSTKEARDSFFNYSATYASRKISLRVFNHLQHLSLRFHLNRKTGAVLRAVSRGSAAYADLLRYISFQIAPILLEVSLVSTYLFVRYSPAFGAITVVVMVMYIATTIIVTEWRNKYRRLATEADDAFNQSAVDALLNFETVLLFCAQDHISDMYDQSLKAVAAASIDSQLSLSLLNILQNAVISFGVALAMALAGREVVAGTMSIGDFVLVNVFILQVWQFSLRFAYQRSNHFRRPPAICASRLPGNVLVRAASRDSTPSRRSLCFHRRMIKAAFVDVEAMFKLLAEGQEVQDIPGARELQVVKVADVRFEEVVFTFDVKRGPILRGVTLHVPAGQKVAVVGASGAGKSTLARLLYRLYNIDSGRILINGVDIATCTQRSVRRWLGIVPQDCVLFNRSLEYNIALGKLAHGELASQEEVAGAAAAAQLADFVSKQPQGYETVVGERGLRLSGGEKQRVAIARALLKSPPIMVCDEATSALDSSTEQEVMHAINQAAAGRTYLVIAHRLSTIADADVIAVLQDGVVAECGTHAQLEAKEGGLYAAMWAKHLMSEAGGKTPSSANLPALASA